MDVGYGKTAIAETALSDLGIFPALVVAPAAVVETDIWGEEAQQWEHLSDLVVTPVRGTAKERLRRLKTDSQIFTLSYDSLIWLNSLLGTNKLSRLFKSVVFDEVQRMKTPGSKRFRRMRARVDVPALGLTATPVGNHLLDLWAEMFIVAGKAPLGPTFTSYRDQYFESIDYWGRVWRLKCCSECRSDRDGCVPRHGSRPYLDCACHRAQLADLRRRIAPYVYQSSTPPKVLGIPPVHINPIRVPMPGAVLRLETDLVGQLWAVLPSGAELEALEASTVAQKRRQIAGGVVYTGAAGDAEAWEIVHTAKLDALDALLDQLQGQPAIVYYWYHHEALAIKKRLAGRAWRDLMTYTDMPGAVREWNEGRLEVLLAQPKTGGAGLNLQGGGHHVVWYTLPWSAEVMHQGNGRVARPGQAAERVESHWLMCGPMDDRVAEVLLRKLDTQREVMRSLTAYDLV
jgi:hypothetical protein